MWCALPFRMPSRFRDREIMNGMPPNLLAHYLYLWELTAVRQAVETAWISASVRRTFIELLVPAGSSSSLGQAVFRTTVSPPNAGEVLRRIDELVDAWGANFLRLVLESYAADGGFREALDGRARRPRIPGGIAGDRVPHRVKARRARALIVVGGSDVYAVSGPEPASGPEQARRRLADVHTESTGLHSTKDVWTRLASTFAMEPHVLFGVCNEPERNYDGTQDAEVWTAMNSVVDAIRAAEAAAGAPQQHVVAVQGTRNWARVLDYYVANPITAGSRHCYGRSRARWRRSAAGHRVVVLTPAPCRSSA
jgi:hypothetical protein